MQDDVAADMGTQIEDEFLAAACVPVDGAGHRTGTLEAPSALLHAHPGLARQSVFVAAVLGDDAEVRRWLALDRAHATARGGPHGWDALTTLCFSNYLRLDPARTAGFVRAAEALLAHGASARTGFFTPGNAGEPEFEAALYGAAGVAQHPELTRLLLAHGADPNDGETVYHTPEGFDDRALEALVESGRLDADSLVVLLVRKLDWTHHEGVAWLLSHGADPNHLGRWGGRALHHALRRDNPLPLIELLLDHGADPSLSASAGRSAVAVAARAGRADVLTLFAQRGFATALTGDDAFIAALARGEREAARAFVAADPELARRLEREVPDLLADFAGAGNTAGVRLMLELGFSLGSHTRHPGAHAGTALHLAVWRARRTTVELLLEHGAPLEAGDGAGETALSSAVRALTEHSEWTPHESNELVALLLAAGARAEAVRGFPTGIAEVDEMLRRAGRS